jgi:succinyl-diaminopimelate desuccinylase
MVLSAILLAATLQTKAASVIKIYDQRHAKKMVPLLTEVIDFPTTQFDADGHMAQKAWIEKAAYDLDLTYRDAGSISEIELPGPPNAPVLGLMVHGDVQPAEADAWSFSPFSGKADKTFVYGRGSADDKGPLVQALLAMTALKDSGIARTHTVRLLIGSDEESNNTDVTQYLKTHQPPDYTLVLDSEFPVVVGEKAWNSLSLTTDAKSKRPGVTKPYGVSFIDAGLSASIVPDRAEVKLLWDSEWLTDWQPVIDAVKAAKLPPDTRIATQAIGTTLRIVAYGHSSHAGVNLESGRNALVALARALDGLLPTGGANDLLAFVRTAGADIYGTGLGITDSDPLWGRYAVNIATIKPSQTDPKLSTLTINIRRTPPRTRPQLQAKMEELVSAFNRRTGASLTATGFYGDEPLAFDPNSKIVKRLLADYAAATGTKNPKPAISGGGTYAKRLPNSIAFGMWFHDKPYPGHDVDEKNPIADLQKGAKVLIYALVDIATGPKIEKPF